MKLAAGLRRDPAPRLARLVPVRRDAAKYVQDSVGNWLNDMAACQRRTRRSGGRMRVLTHSLIQLGRPGNWGKPSPNPLNGVF